MNNAEEKENIELREDGSHSDPEMKEALGEVLDEELVLSPESESSDQSGETGKSKSEPEKEELSLEQKLEAAKTKADENYQNYLRAVADLDTYKRRVIREKDELRQYALAGLLESILPIYDNMSLGLVSAETDADPKVVVQGIQMVLSQFKSVLEENGIEEIEPAKGDAFDPNAHEAVQTQISEEVEQGRVLQLIRKGFSLRGRLIRPAAVIVAGEDSN